MLRFLGPQHECREGIERPRHLCHDAGGYLSDLNEGFFEALEWVTGMLDADDRSRLILDSSTRAAMLSNAFGYFIAPRLLPRRVHWQSSGRMQRGVIRQAILLRFKKLTHDLCSMNIHSEVQRRAYEQEWTLPNARRLTVITFGYTLDSLGRAVSGLHFVCPNGWHTNLWTWPILEAEDGQRNLIDGPFDPDSTTDADTLATDIRIRVRRKQAE